MRPRKSRLPAATYASMKLSEMLAAGQDPSQAAKKARNLESESADYAGFAVGTCIKFKKLLGFPVVSQEIKQGRLF